MNILIIFLLLGTLTSCTGDASNNSVTPIDSNENIQDNNMESKIRLTIGSETFTATLFDNATAKEFSAMLPLTLKMRELNENEKYADLTTGLPTNPSRPPSINTGDLMLYGNRTIVLFYKTFTSSYSYTNIGRVENPERIAAALGTGDISVTIEND